MSVSGESTLDVFPFSVLCCQMPFGRWTTPGRRSASISARVRTSPSSLKTETESPSEIPRASASVGGMPSGTSFVCSWPSVELIVRDVAGEISASG